MEVTKQIRIYNTTHKRLKVKAAEAGMSLIELIDFISQKP